MPVELSQPALAACALLFVQNTFSTLVISYSRLRPGPAYVGSVVVALGELVKIVLNLLCNLAVFGYAATREELRRVYSAEARQLWVYSVPALLYTVQNNLTFIGAAHLSVVAFQATNQLRIPATALVATLLLGQDIGRQRWLAVIMLTAGVVLVTMRPDAPGKHTSFHSAHRTPLVGIGALVGASSCSALASVWFERIVKTKSSPSLWVSSHLLACWALPLALLATLHEAEVLRTEGPWRGIDSVAIAVVANQAGAGLVVGLTLKYASSVLKTFATSLALVFVCFVSWLYFEAKLAPLFLLGVGLVLGATALYALQPCPSLDEAGRRGAGARAAEDQTALETALPLIKGEVGEVGEVGGVGGERRAHSGVEAPAATAASEDSRR